MMTSTLAGGAFDPRALQLGALCLIGAMSILMRMSCQGQIVLLSHPVSLLSAATVVLSGRSAFPRQMLQGENCPANVKQLREHIELKGKRVVPVPRTSQLDEAPIVATSQVPHRSRAVPTPYTQPLPWCGLEAIGNTAECQQRHQEWVASTVPTANNSGHGYGCSTVLVAVEQVERGSLDEEQTC